jgi:hypothetical protein
MNSTDKTVVIERQLRTQAEARSAKLENQLFEATEALARHVKGSRAETDQGTRELQGAARELAELRKAVKLEQVARVPTNSSHVRCRFVLTRPFAVSQRATDRADKQGRAKERAERQASKRGVEYRAEAEELRRALADAHAELAVRSPPPPCSLRRAARFS